MNAAGLWLLWSPLIELLSGVFAFAWLIYGTYKEGNRTWKPFWDERHLLRESGIQGAETAGL